jgi:hypothetical protein
MQYEILIILRSLSNAKTVLAHYDETTYNNVPTSFALLNADTIGRLNLSSGVSLKPIDDTHKEANLNFVYWQITNVSQLLPPIVFFNCVRQHKLPVPSFDSEFGVIDDLLKNHKADTNKDKFTLALGKCSNSITSHRYEN